MRKLVSIIFFFLLTLFLISSTLPITSSLADGTYATIGTGDAADAGSDALNFSQAKPFTVDKYGKYILLTENRISDHHWAYSNDSGSTWTQGSETYSFLLRGSVAYDSINDKLHVIWTTGSCDVNGGIIYRRYGISRDGSHNITGITREDSANINLQLDKGGSSTCEYPIALWNNDGTANGSLIAIWTADATNQTQVRASMRHLSLSAADGIAGNWGALDGSAATFSTNGPDVPADKIYASASNGTAAPSATVRGGSGARKNDLYVFVASNVSGTVVTYRGVWNSSNHDWSGGFQLPITIGSLSETSGYGAKHELLTHPILDTATDRLYLGWARWKDNSAGDTWSISYLDSTDTVSSIFDSYSANGTHVYAPTGDIAYDPTTGYLYVSYLESTTNGTNGSMDYKLFDGSTFGSQTRFYTNTNGSAGADGSGDIPSMYSTRQDGHMLFSFRVNGAIPPTAQDPHKIYFGYITPISPTNTPTPTPVPTNTPTPTPTTVPVSSTSISPSSSPSSTPDPNSHAGWTYAVKAGPGYIGTAKFLVGDGDARNAMVFIGKEASPNDLYISITKSSPGNLLGAIHPIPFPWMQGFNTASDIFEFKAFSAFNGYPVTKFTKPVTIVLPYNLQNNPLISPKRLRIGWYDIAKKRWILLPGINVVSVVNKTVAITTTSFGYFAVIYPR